jgi:WD40 repeat protein
VRVWDAATGTPRGDPFTGHTSPVSAVAFGQLDGRPVVISGSGDRTVRVWDGPLAGLDGLPPIRGNGCRVCIDVAATVLAVAIDDNGQTASGAELGIVCFRFPR